MKFLMTATVLALALTSTAKADICGITKTAQGRTASNIIRAQIAQSVGKLAILIDDMTGKQTIVTDALVSSINGVDLGDAKYFDFKVKVLGGAVESIDIGHTYIKLTGTNKAVSLNSLTGCGLGVASSKAVITVR